MSSLAETGSYQHVYAYDNLRPPYQKNDHLKDLKILLARLEFFFFLSQYVQQIIVSCLLVLSSDSVPWHSFRTVICYEEQTQTQHGHERSDMDNVRN